MKKKLPFKKSKRGSLGIELEYQIIDPMTFDLISRAKELIRNISNSPYKDFIKPEITQSMIEINSSIHANATSLAEELSRMQSFILKKAKKIGIMICGGGTHPFQKWSLCKIFPTKRFRILANRYKYLSKRSTVFGLHVHVGCKNAEEALYLTHALSRYVPQLIAISASSPFYQSVDTGFNTTRATVFSAYPSSGVMPYLVSWQEFSEYFYSMQQLGIVSSMKDFYWDIRPKPEFGTVEIRVCDTPLTLEKAVIIATYIQSLSRYLLSTKTVKVNKCLYYLYGYNRFQASRYGFEGDFINPTTLKHTTIKKDILLSIKKIKKYCKKLKNKKYIDKLEEIIKNKDNDAKFLKEVFKSTKSLKAVVQAQCSIWAKKSKKI